MNNENDKYTELIDLIKTKQVELSNPQAFTSRIMHDIEFLSKKKIYDKTLHVISLISSFAALLLVGLFVFEQFSHSPKMEEYKSSNRAVNSVLPNYNTNCYIENSNDLNELNKLIQIKKERQKRQKTFYLIINKYKIL